MLFNRWGVAVVLLAVSAHAAALHQAAPLFSLNDFHRKPHAMAEYRGKAVLINFWASWCAPCQQELPELNQLAMEYKKKNVRVVAISVDTDPAAAKALLSKLGVNSFQTLWDKNSKVVSRYDISAMPSSFILDRHGTIRFIHAGFHPGDPAVWRQEIDRLLNE